VAIKGNKAAAEANPAAIDDLAGQVIAAKTRADKKEARRAYHRADEKAVTAELTRSADQAVLSPQRGRPAKWSEELAHEICVRLSKGQSLNRICDLPHMPSIPTVWAWARERPDFFSAYMRAREDMAHTLFDQCIDIADDVSRDTIIDELGNMSSNPTAVARAKLQIDTRMRIAGKISPKVYGERIDGVAGQVNVQVNSVTVDARQLEPSQRDALRQVLLAAKVQD